MTTPGTTPPTPPPGMPPGQTIVVERRERSGCVRRLAGPALLVIGLLLIAGTMIGDRTGRLDERYVAGEVTDSRKVAIVEVEGIIMGETVEYALKQIRQARDDSSVKAVVLRVDSPGGTVSGSDRIWREVAILKESKPVVVSMGGLAASGGYYIAAAGDHVFAEPTTITGSIGVILEVPQIKGLMDKYGVEVETVKTGKWKDSGSLFRPMTDEEKTRWEAVIDDSYRRFVRVVAQGRKLPLEEVEGLADGRVYTADEALKARMVDEIGYRDDAIHKAQKLAGLEAMRAVRYAKPPRLLDALLSMSAPRPGLTFDADELLKLRTPQVLMIAR